MLVSGVKGCQPARVYEKGVAQRSKSNSKSFWKYVSSKTKIISDIPDLYMETDNMTQNDTDKANVLGDFFSRVQTKEPDWCWILPDKAKPKYKLEIDINEDIILKKILISVLY